jgi:hypothetical protein
MIILLLKLRRLMPTHKVDHDVAPDPLLVILLDPVSPTGGGEGGRQSSGLMPPWLDR